MQYIAHDYLDLLDQFQARPSMGQVGNCYENALAERLNGILKLEYNLDNWVVPKPTADKSKRVNSLSIHENWGMNGKMCRD